jgi:flagellar basal-body rod protein FlgF
MYIHNRLGMTDSVESMLGQERRMSQIANNLANINTTGYKRENSTFWEMLYDVNSSEKRVGKGVKDLIGYEQGSLERSGNPTDLAINGEGYFKVQTPDGVRYTRGGNFQLNAQRQLVTPHGHQLLGQGGPITLGSIDWEISREGWVMVDGAQADVLDIVTFNDYLGIEKAGKNLFKIKNPNTTERPSTDYEVQQGYTEQSNSNTIKELTDMMALQRHYEGQAEVLKKFDELDGAAITRVGKLTA